MAIDKQYEICVGQSILWVLIKLSKSFHNTPFILELCSLARRALEVDTVIHQTWNLLWMWVPLFSLFDPVFIYKSIGFVILTMSRYDSIKVGSGHILPYLTQPHVIGTQWTFLESICESSILSVNAEISITTRDLCSSNWHYCCSCCPFGRLVNLLS